LFDLPIIKECLSTKRAKKGEEKLRDGEDHIFVKKIQDHFPNSDIGPMPMN